MFERKVHSALCFLLDIHGSGVLNIDDQVDNEGHTVLDGLRSKHPSPKRADASTTVTTTNKAPEIHPVLFERLTGQMIRNAALCTQGAAGPSGVDANGWRRQCTAFHKHSSDLCAAVAATARRLSSEILDPSPLSGYLACRLNPLNKNPGINWTCEVVRGIIGKVILAIMRDDVRNTAGSLQLCCGQEGGCEAAAHAMREIFRSDHADGVILVDASNTFNNLNRQVALYNLQYICPAIAKVLINCYRQLTNLFVGGTTVASQEGNHTG